MRVWVLGLELVQVWVLKLGLGLGLKVLPPLQFLLTEPSMLTPVPGTLSAACLSSEPSCLYACPCICSKCWAVPPRDMETASSTPHFGCCCIKQQLLRLSAWTEAENSMQAALTVMV